MEEKAFVFYGKPPTKTAQQKRVAFINKKAIFYNSKEQKKQNAFFISEINKQKGNFETLNQGIEIEIKFYFKKKSAKDLMPKITRPDLDNLAKALIDCFVKAGVIEDDGLVYKLVLEKYYFKEEKTEVKIKWKKECSS